MARQVESPKEENAPPAIGVGWWIASTEVGVPHDEPLKLTLGPMEIVHGRVTDLNGKALEGFHIQAVPLRLASEAIDLPPWVPHDWTFSSQFNSEGGAFEFVGLQPGEWSIWVRSDDYAKPVPKRIRIPRLGPIEFEVDRLVELNGRIEDSNGQALHGVASAKWADNGLVIAAGTASDKTWGNGLFRLHVPATKVEVQATVEGGVSEVLSLDLADHRSRDELRLVVPRTR